MKTKLSKPTITGLGLACATLLLTGSLIWMGRVVHAQRGPEPPPSGSSAIDRLAAGRYFPERLLWVGQTAPTEAESQLLESLLVNCRGRGAYEAVATLEEFLTALPDSAWAASLRCNLAYYYRVRGRYTLALAHWQAAWEATRHFETGTGRRIADYTLVHWTQLLASLGRVEELESLFAETGDRRMSLLSWQHKWNKSLGSFAMMKRRPEVSYRCGTLALMRVGRILGAAVGSGELAEIPSPSTGFSLSSLLAMAAQRGIAVEAVERVSGTELVVPSVVHWKQNHYAAITERRGEMYLVEDPTFGTPQSLRADVINEEASGFFLVPANQRPAGWRVLSNEEAELIYGKGMNSEDPPPAGPPCPEEGQDACDCPPPNSPPPSSPPPPPPPPNSPPSAPPDSDCDSCVPINNFGMPTWNVTEPYISL
jgi:hypothetical protein